MANDFSRNPWVLDTPGATSHHVGPIKIDQIEFVGYSVATDICEVTDLDGKLIARLDGDADFKSVRTGNIGWSHRGLILSTLSGGTGKCLVYIR